MTASAYDVPPTVICEEAAGGVMILRHGLTIDPVEQTIPGRLRHWAEVRPDALFLTQEEQAITYGEAERRRREIAARLLGLPLSPDRPLAIVAENGIDHALMMLAATSIGLPVAVISPSYIAPGARPWAKFGQILDQITPGLIVSDQPEMLDAVLAGIGRDGPKAQPLTELDWLLAEPSVPAGDLAAAEASVGPDSVAKLLFTSGSTGQPKPVPNTQRMMVSNMQGLAALWPFLRERPPVSVDWLPWNHTFGGNCCFNITLWFGGHSHIDSGRPVPAAIGRSIEAIRRWRPTLYYNVPAGFESILPTLEADRAFAADFFGNLDFLFNAGAPLPPALRHRVEAASLAAAAAPPSFVAGWGATETAPFSTVLHFLQSHANNLGVPIPGTAIKLVPDGDRYELRVKGPNVMPGYWRDDRASAAAFDEDGFYRIGDAGRLADPHDPAAGILFDGRVAENFKLSTGTWVNVGALRLAVISACRKLVSDAVVTGEGKADIGLLLVLNEEACRLYLESAGHDLPAGSPACLHPAVRTRIEELIDAYNAEQMGSSTRISRFAVMERPPSLEQGEITDKAYINQRRTLALRADAVERLYA
ncbi:Long-chain-fatty-acid--CoA ligase [Sphingobium chlorophenolicum L-1]|uniref:Long-chain-fatty-acid--CoA ligase n=1 Tax=Sphingobium chlorophenolicum L-1 TaxID=690566 RepID=F6F3M0_SPHCR|nr:AMP-binding protein [Sphingobium chlorophenolicum]AEG51032.1 Long-chain-fatty-acid--CoA ligase [Sphingobium chlorophenolicum L-1]